MGTRQSARGARAATDDNVVRVQADIRDSAEQERIKRYTREYKQSAEMEEALDTLSRFSYEPVDYAPALIRKQWVEPAIPDFAYLLDEARMRITNKYYANIVLQSLAGICCVILSLSFLDSVVAAVGVAGLAGCAIALNRELQHRRLEMDRALSTARELIDSRIKEIRESIDKARQTFEENENRRIERIQRLMSAEPAAVFERIDEVLQNWRLPFYMRCDVDFYNMEPFLTLHLPGHNIIPAQIVTLSPAGVIDYEEKNALEINQKYSEAIAGVAISIALLLCAYLPPLNTIHIRGIYDRWEDQEYNFGLKFPRQGVDEVLTLPSAIAAFHRLEATFEIGANGNFSPLERQLQPEWLEGAPRERILSAKVTIPSRF